MLIVIVSLGQLNQSISPDLSSSFIAQQFDNAQQFGNAQQIDDVTNYLGKFMSQENEQVQNNQIGIYQAPLNDENMIPNYPTGL